MKFWTTLIFIITLNNGFAQPYIKNANFELYSSCPTSYGTFNNKISNWISSIDSPDYYNCSFYDIGAYPTNTLAFSGSGYVGFGLYGDANGSCETIFQTLNQPFLPGITYSISLVAKRANGGAWSTDSCGGVELYGTRNAMFYSLTGTHISQLPNTFFLGKTSLIGTINWRVFSFNFTPTDTIHNIFLTIEKIPNCYQYVFLDYINSGIFTGIEENNLLVNSIKIYPNPLTNSLCIKTELNDFENSEIEIINTLGQIVLKLPYANSIDVSRLAQGFYNLKISSINKRVYYSKFIKE